MGTKIYNQYLQLNNLENEKIVNNLQKLNYIQNTISTKDKLINQINKNTESQSKIIKNILFITSAIILSGLIIKFSPKFKKLVILIWAVLGIHFMYDYNIFYFQDLFNVQKIDAIIDEAADDTYNELDKYFGSDDSDDNSNTNYNDWVDDNCDCNNNNDGADSEYSENEESDYYDEEISPLTSGIYYYDGTAPKQLINPLPNKNNTDKIYYPDYDKPVFKLNNHKNNKNLKERRVLVGSNTYTSNL
jgi:hypothetical protein